MSASELDTEFAGAEVPIGPTLHLVVGLPHVEVPLRYHGWQRHVKRLVDVGVGTVGLVATLPLLMLIAAGIRLTSRGSVIYRQERVGQNGVSFRIVKFRTMYRDADARLEADPELYARYVANDFKLGNHDDPRVTPFGRFLRNTSLDELPQLLNVLAGTMSLVGPRPIVRVELARYGSAVESYFQLRPGLTGRWQVEGRNSVRYPERALLDHDYLCTWSLRQDLLIMMRTIPSVLRRRGCH